MDPDTMLRNLAGDANRCAMRTCIRRFMQTNRSVAHAVQSLGSHDESIGFCPAGLRVHAALAAAANVVAAA